MLYLVKLSVGDEMGMLYLDYAVSRFSVKRRGFVKLYQDVKDGEKVVSTAVLLSEDGSLA